MPGLTNAESQATLDARFPVTGASDFVQYSTNGTTEFAGLTGTAIGATGWSAAATSAGTITHFRVATAATAGTGRTDWTALTASRTVAIGDQLTHAVGSI